MQRLYMAAVNNIEQAKGQAFNIGGGVENSLSLLELFAILENLLDIKIEYTRMPVRQSDQRVFISNIGKAERLLGWRPAVTTKDGIARMIEWISNAR
jgi:CDP-paratose 2-epimerase